ncbi:MAG: DUF4080 domain-containing protein [Firmicutes bacterium]|nr:DUF4080 domain-containing protein [Bacillota bacterium]
MENEDAPIMDMEAVPFPYDGNSMEQDKVIYYESSRGCPYRCSYCLSSLDKKIRVLPLERVKEELSFFLEQKVKQVKFIDRTFNFDKDRAYAIWNHLMDHDNGVTNFHFEICGEILDDRLFDLLGQARDGLFQFEIGIQSANGEALEAVDRKDNVDAIFANVKRLIALGNIHIHVDLIAGLPFEGYDSFGESFNRVYKLGADNLQLGFLKLLKGTKVRQQLDEHGFVFRDKAPYEIISNKYLSALELMKLKMIENVLDLFSNKGGFAQTVAYLERKIAKSPFDLYDQIATCFYESGYQHRSYKKDDLYRILLKFAENHHLVDSEMAEEVRFLLMADLEATMNADTVKKFHKKGWDI